ncbi:MULTISPECIES: c-type cytochrome biogenesis protein CcsB [unclassified Planococcus (in: firmicutes)]|uniref:c-type cytochrome biogenesis protein CcsB n=1 Tax=unclassified Planococcus (in: firmicutes) TaxID=2662419 RepID=UPI00266035D9|nr:MULTISPECIES: c-type cytochrome biogenesis protein CcsB [unclassified Planococcus (in: firmicutes)]
MSTEALVSLSSSFLFFSFIIFLIAIIPFGVAVKSKKQSAVKIAMGLTIIGFAAQLGYFILRWVAAGHAPVSNLNEFLTFFGIMLIGSFLGFFYIYRQPVVGLFLLPVAILIIAYASMFANEVSPLIPALQSHWLTIHVITVATASAVLSVSFVTGLIYLLKKVDTSNKSKSGFFLEMVLYFLVVVVGFILVTSAFGIAGYSASYQFENQEGQSQVYEYALPAIVVPNEAQAVSGTAENYEPASHYAGFVEIPNNVETAKLNSVLWSFVIGTVLYVVIRLIARKKISQLLQPFTNKVDLTLMDEISYRSVVIGFPLFALGGLFFAMIWAQIAWSRFWGWDPKEVWALITFLFYAAFLHLRIGKEWTGEKTAWLAIIGFGTIIFNQVFVNLVISGLHSYA